MNTAHDKGRTIFEMAREWWRGSTVSPSLGAEIRAAMPDVFNPLTFSLGGFVRIETAELMARTFSVEQISEFKINVAKREFRFTDYSLNDPDPKSGEDGFWVTIRAMPTKGKIECILLRPHDELEYSQEIVAALDGDTIVDNASGLTYRKLGSYDASIREATKDGLKRLSLKYWDFINEEGPEVRYYVVEMDLSDREGMIQTYLGSPIAVEDVKPIAGHVR